MLKRTRIHMLLCALLMALMVTGCGKASEIKITSCSLLSVNMAGLRGVNAELALGVHNPMALSFKATDIHGNIQLDGKDVALFTADDLDISRKSDALYQLPVSGTLAEGQSLMKLMAQLRGLNLDRVTLNVYVKAKLRSGISIKKSFTDMKLSELMK